MRLTLLSAADLRSVLPMRDAIDAMRRAFTAHALGTANAPLRSAIDVAGAGTTLLMGAALPAADGEAASLCSKIVSVFGGNRARGLPVIHGLVVVLDPETGAPCALCDGTFLTAWRTGAASGLATELLARRDARVAAVFGAGVQARTQAIAIDAVRDLDELRIFARTADDVARCVRELASELRARPVAAKSARSALDGADVVCTATTARRPVFESGWLRDGSHVNAIGTFQLDAQELDVATVQRARVFVDDREAALAEAGELVEALRAGATDPARWTPLGLLACGRAEGRRTDGEVTLFKSVGHAVQDAAAAGAALLRARRLGIGRAVEL